MIAVEFHSYTEHRKTSCDDLPLDDDSRRDLQSHIGKAPDILDPESDEPVRHLLSGCARNADDSDIRRSIFQTALDGVDIKNLPAAYLFTDFGGIAVEDGFDSETVVVEVVVTEKGRAETSGSDESGRDGILPSEVIFDVFDDLIIWSNVKFI